MTHRVSRSTWYILAMIYVSMFAMVIATMLYTNYVASVNARKWCTLLTTLDEGYRSTPPRTDTGRQVAADIHRLRGDLKCGGNR